MIRSEYIRFLQALNTTSVPDDVRRLANLILQHLDTLCPLTTAQGQRIKKIVQLAQENWNSTNSDMQIPLEQATKQTCSITRLTKLSVGPFRGFSKQEDFDLASQLVLIYGPNGTGKSSFCEALEYCLLGTVAEAENKRFRNQQDYLVNAYTKRFMPPALIAEDNQGNYLSVSANEALLRFCFVEKSRIDNFSRIAAQAPAKQSELISTLFGLDVYTEFVRNFTDTINDKYIDLEGAKAKDLATKRRTLAGYEQQLKITIPEEFQNIENEQGILANEYRNDCTFVEMKIELNGSTDNPGLITQLDDDIQKPINSKSTLTIDALHDLEASIRKNINELNTKQGELSKVSQQVSFKQLYEAITQVKENSSEKCPACHTPLIEVQIDPYEHAEAELQKLEHLGQLQEAVEKLKGNVANSLSKLSKIVGICCSSLPENNLLAKFITVDENDATIDWWNLFQKKTTDEFIPWQHVEAQVRRLEAADKLIEQTQLVREEKRGKLIQLRQLADKILRLETRRDTASKAQKNAEEAIEKFDVENAELIEDVEAEKAVIVQNKSIAKAYIIFVQKLNDHADSLPTQLVADLGETIVRLYNAFNRNDAENEQLSKVRLPLQQNQRLEIAYNNDQDTFFDALHILSEGHIRCLGLAILTAKNIKEHCPLLIFDDPVNAIDDDHRESIRRTLFEDSFFENKQIILTCHGEEFFKDIQNLLTVNKSNQS